MTPKMGTKTVRYSKQYKTTLKGKLRSDLEFYAHDNEMKECEVMREAVRFYLDNKMPSRFTVRKP